jgi:hypothetical protein
MPATKYKPGQIFSVRRGATVTTYKATATGKRKVSETKVTSKPKGK